MKDFLTDGLKVMVKITTEGEMSIHTVPFEWTEKMMDSMADELLDTEGAEKHDLGVDDTSIMRAVIYSYNQSYGHLLDFNQHLTDGRWRDSTRWLRSRATLSLHSPRRGWR